MELLLRVSSISLWCNSDFYASSHTETSDTDLLKNSVQSATSESNTDSDESTTFKITHKDVVVKLALDKVVAMDEVVIVDKILVMERYADRGVVV